MLYVNNEHYNLLIKNILRLQFQELDEFEDEDFKSIISESFEITNLDYNFAGKSNISVTTKF